MSKVSPVPEPQPQLPAGSVTPEVPEAGVGGGAEQGGAAGTERGATGRVTQWSVLPAP